MTIPYNSHDCHLQMHHLHLALGWCLMWHRQNGGELFLLSSSSEGDGTRNHFPSVHLEPIVDLQMTMRSLENILLAETCSITCDRCGYNVLQKQKHVLFILKNILKVDIILHGIMYPYTDVFLFSTISANLTELSEKKQARAPSGTRLSRYKREAPTGAVDLVWVNQMIACPEMAACPCIPTKHTAWNYNTYIYMLYIQYIMYDLPKFQHGTLPNLTLSANYPAKMVHISIPTTQFHYLLSLHCLLTWHLLWLLGLLLRLCFMKPRASSNTWSSQPIHANTLK